MLFLKLILLLWSINFAPPFMAHMLEGKWDSPLDRGYKMPDGGRLFGDHKTIRGVLSGILAGIFAAIIFEFPWWLGLGVGILSMAGDLFSSFLKRRFSFTCGDVVPGLDQAPEALLPFLLLGPYFSLSTWYIFACAFVFGFGAYLGSIFLNQILMEKPYESYPRKIRATVRLREILSCGIITKPFYYLVNFEDAVYYHVIMRSVFMALGIYERGKQNALEIDTENVTFDFPDLPPAFDGYKILFLTDLHLDGLEGLTEKLSKIIRKIPADLCILGGDYRMAAHGEFAEPLSLLRRLMSDVKPKDGTYAILGNHDCIEIVENLQDTGIRFLINDSKPIERDGERIWLVGVDDPHYYKCHDLAEAFSEVPLDGFSIFFAHSNEIYRQARPYEPKVYICGHTHGGQILIPPIGPIFTHSSAPRSMCQGNWNYEGMRGYTSRGAGVSGVPVRYNCRGEVTVITLRKSPVMET